MAGGAPRGRADGGSDVVAGQARQRTLGEGGGARIDCSSGALVDDVGHPLLHDDIIGAAQPRNHLPARRRNGREGGEQKGRIGLASQMGGESRG